MDNTCTEYRLWPLIIPISSSKPIIIKIILKIVKIDSSYNLIWKVVPGVTTRFERYFCKFTDGLNSLKSCPLISKSLFG